tara:strand:+ start:943 stop:2034 length:1092 start_codon:yes stop_codon:yes gene_type:complete
MSLRVVKTKIKDYSQIKSLFKRNNLNFMSKDTWLNFSNNPLFKKNKKIELGWKFELGNKIVGHIGYYPTIYRYNKKKLIFSILHGWAVDEKYRSASIILLKKYLNQKKKDLFLGTTFNRHTGQIMRSLGVKQVPIKGLDKSSIIILNVKNFLEMYFQKKNFLLKKFFISTISLAIKIFLWRNINRWKNYKVSHSIKRVKNFDKKFKYFWNNYLKENGQSLQVDRDINWQNWLMKKKLTNNQIITFVFILKNKIVGYSACLMEKKGKYKICKLLDLITLKNSKDYEFDLVLKNLEKAQETNCDYFEYRNTSASKLKILESFSAIQIKLKQNNFYYKANNNKLNKIFETNKNWNPCSLDGDILIR